MARVAALCLFASSAGFGTNADVLSPMLSELSDTRFVAPVVTPMGLSARTKVGLTYAVIAPDPSLRYLR